MDQFVPFPHAERRNQAINCSANSPPAPAEYLVILGRRNRQVDASCLEYLELAELIPNFDKHGRSFHALEDFTQN